MPAVALDCHQVKSSTRSAIARSLDARAAILLAGLCLAAPCQAQSPPQTQPQTQRVEVVGAGPGAGLEIPRDQIPANVQRASANDVERSHAVDLSAFLGRQMGSVHLSEVQNNPFQPDLSFRGFTASPLLGTAQGLSIYVDGVRLNQPFGDVVSWDLIPKSAIAAVTLMPGANPLFGLNTLGGALAIDTKDGLSDPGSSVQWLAGGHGRRALEFEAGGKWANAGHWFVTANQFSDRGWRPDSPSDVRQGFAKIGRTTERDKLALSLALADNTLHGNGLQEQRLLARDYASVYTLPDITRNRAMLLNLAGRTTIADGLTLSAQAYARRIRSSTLNGDANGNALDQPVYQPDADERAVLAAAGYSGVPVSGANAGNTPFPSWRCIAQALRAQTDPVGATPMTRCNAILNRTATEQSNHGVAAQLNWVGMLGGRLHRALLGLALDTSRVRFDQGAQLGTLNPDRSITPVAVQVDGHELADDGSRYDNRVALSARTVTASAFASDTVALASGTHLSLAARHNRVSVRNRDLIQPGGGPGSLDGDHVFARLNPAIGITHAASPALTAYAGWSQGSRAPSAVELGCADPATPCKLPNAFAGDPPLRQVRVNSLEAGLRSRIGSDGGWNLGVFRADSSDDILFVADAQSGFGYFKNFGRTRRQGLEAGLRAELGRASLSINLTLLDASYQSAEALNGAGNSSNDTAQAGLPGQDGNIAIRPGDRIALAPKQILKLSLSLPLGAAWRLGADLSAVSASLARGNENNRHQPDAAYYLGPGRNPGYAMLNLNLDWQPLPGVTAFAQLNNAADRRYSSAAQLGVTALDGQGHYLAQPLPLAANGVYPLLRSTFFAPGAPRLLTLGLRWRFGG